jgi:cytochrome c556
MMAPKTTTSPRLRAVLIGLGLLWAAGSAQSQELDPATAVNVREDGYREVGAAYKNLTDELKKSTPLAFMVQRSATTISKDTRRMPNWFPVGSGPAPGVKTAAKPIIWTKRAEFDALQKKLIADAAQLDKLVAAGDMKAIKAQAKALGDTCESCHDKFRERED